MPNESIRVEGSTASDARLKRLVVVIVKCIIIILFHRTSVRLNLATEDLVKVRRSCWAGSTLGLRFLLLLDVPLLLARLQMDLETLGSVLATTDIAHEHLRSERPRCLFDRWLRLALAHLLVSDQSIMVESPTTPVAPLKHVVVIGACCDLVIKIHFTIGSSCAFD